MADRPYIFAIQKKTYEFWQRDGDNIVATNQPYFLKFAPNGWQGFSVDNTRNKNYWGVDRTVSMPFSYVEDGGDILRYIMSTLGIEESAYLSICKLQVEVNKKPKGNISINTLSAGDNLGIITSDPNTTVYVQLVVTGIANQDNVSGQIGDNFIGQFIGTKIYAVTIGENGQANFNVFLDNSGGGAATFTITDAKGNSIANFSKWYKQVYKGEIDLSDFKSDGTTVTCSTLEDGLAKYLKASENTVFEFKLNVDAAVWVKMDGINLHQKANYTITNGISNVDGFYALDFPFTGADGDQYGVESLTQVGEAIPSTQGSEPNSQIYYVKNSGNFFFQNTGTVDVNIVVKGSIYPFSSKNNTAPKSGSTLKIKSSYPNGSGGTVEYPIFTLVPVVGASYAIDVNIPITVHPKEKLFLIGSTNSTNPDLYDFEFKEKSNLGVSFITRRPATYVRGLRGQYVFSELINKVTEGNYKAAYCPFFSRNDQIIWTSSNGIRGFNDAVLKISLSDFYNDYNSWFSAGLTEIGKTVLMDEREQLIDKSKVVDLGQVSGFNVTVAKELLFNVLNVGYQPISSDVGTLNGNEEFNCGFQFTVGTTKSPAELTKICKSIASCYEIEKVRTTTLNKDTTSYTNDNKNFVLFVEKGQQNDIAPSYFNLDRSLNATATGLLERDTVFNLALSPHRMMLNNGNEIRSRMYLADNLIMKYTTAEKNNKLVSGGITEKADEPILTIGKRYFYPLLLNFTVPAPADLIGMLDLNPLTKFAVEANGTTFTGILENVSNGSDSTITQNYTLLSTADNDLQKMMARYE